MAMVPLGSPRPLSAAKVASAPYPHAKRRSSCSSSTASSSSLPPHDPQELEEEEDDAEEVEDPWNSLRLQCDALVEELEAERKVANRVLPRLEPSTICKCCGHIGDAVVVPCPPDITPSLWQCGTLSSWVCALRGLFTPHCASCGTVTVSQASGVLAKFADLRDRVAAGGPLAWHVELVSCACCGGPLASDAIFCVRCGTTSPRGGYVLKPRLQRCARCGAEVASDAGLCLMCGTACFRPPGFFSAGPQDTQLVGCPGCGRFIAADALFCVHCGDAGSSMRAAEEEAVAEKGFC